LAPLKSLSEAYMLTKSWNQPSYPRNTSVSRTASALKLGLILNSAKASSASTTLSQIGFVETLKKGGHAWNNLHDAIIAEKDPAKQAELRKHSVVSDVYLGSAHAIAKTGEIVIASASGSQLPHVVFTSPTVILVVSTQKITESLAEAHERLEKHVIPLEDARMKSVGMGGTVLAKEFVWKVEPAFMGRKIHVLFVEEKLGF
jgi:hypothetical protein